MPTEVDLLILWLSSEKMGGFSHGHPYASGTKSFGALWLAEGYGKRKGQQDQMK